MKTISVLKSYLLFSVIYLLLPFLGFESGSWFLKPFIVLFLLLAVWISSNFSTKKILIGALIFSWIGDILLMFVYKNELFFILGLACFLVSHLFYIWLFSKQPKTETPLDKKFLLVGAVLFLTYFAAIISVLLPSLGALQVPVTVYATVITTMIYTAYKGSLQWAKPAGFIILLGAILFVASDSILAFNKFYTPLPLADFLIMLTYILAQYCITRGVLKLNNCI